MRFVYITLMALFAFPINSHASLYTYTGNGSITLNEVEHDIQAQFDIDSLPYSNGNPLPNAPAWELGEVAINMYNGTVFIDGLGLFQNTTGGASGFLSSVGLSYPIILINDVLNLTSPDGMYILASTGLEFLDFDDSPYTGTSSFQVVDPWSLEYGMCAPKISIFGQSYEGTILGESYSNNDIILSLTLTRQGPSVPLPATIYLFGSGFIGLAGLRRYLLKRHDESKS